jgi:hydrogenase nickel incorporation protein HypA/HybF
MHELSIADALLAIVTEHSDGRQVMRVDVEVGHLRQVVPSALAFAFELLAQGTCAAGAELRLHEVPVRTRCRVCRAVSRQTRFPMSCASCQGADLEIVTGEELRVESLEVSDAQPVLEEVT